MRRLTSLTLAVLTVAFAASVALVTPTPAAAERPDPWITFKTKIALLTSEGLDGLDINVDTVDGLVTLHGRVDSKAQSAEADRVAKGIEGVRGVRNLLQVSAATKSDRKFEKRADADTKKQLEDALSASPALKDSHVKVASVTNGIALLSGSAETLTDQLLAIEIARGTPGVSHVASEITGPNELYDAEIWRDGEVGAGSGTAEGASIADAWITMETKFRLLANDQTPALEINVDTQDGTVTLFGVVPTADSKRLAEVETRKVGGVKDVRNELQVVAPAKKDAVDLKDDQIQAVLVKALEGRGYKSVSVEVKNGVARLTGTVPSQVDRLSVAVVARSTGGVRSVTNELAVKPKAS